MLVFKVIFNVAKLFEVRKLFDVARANPKVLVVTQPELKYGSRTMVTTPWFIPRKWRLMSGDTSR